MQLVKDADEEYFPDAQFEQAVEDATEYEPAAQAPVTAVRAVVAQNDPPGHAVHAVAPSTATKVPTRQLEQPMEAEDDENFPDKQLEHALEEAVEYELAAQAPDTALRPDVAQ